MNKHENMVGSTKVGIILVTQEIIKSQPDNVMRIMSKLIPIQVIPHVSFGLFEYLAVSNEFDELEANELIPQYNVDIHDDGGITFTRKSYKKKTSESVMSQIMQVMSEHNVLMSDFKAFIKRFQPNVSDDVFETYNEDFLEALNIYVNRTKK